LQHFCLVINYCYIVTLCEIQWQCSQPKVQFSGAALRLIHKYALHTLGGLGEGE